MSLPFPAPVTAVATEMAFRQHRVAARTEPLICSAILALFLLARTHFATVTDNATVGKGALEDIAP